jgi:hypothetical protein
VAGPAGERGEKGERGEPGSPGRDALQVDILPAIDLAKSYPRGTFARHDGGIIRSFRDTIPGPDLAASGWEVVLAGISQLEFSQGTDGRSFTLTARLTGGTAAESIFSIPVMIYRGIYQPERQYELGDTVTWGGSIWHRQTTGAGTTPGDNGDWKLIVKEGRRGKDGKPGERGPQGPPGRDGRDLTQLAPDGRKY